MLERKRRVKVVLWLLLVAPLTGATPPDYVSFDRLQRIGPDPAPEDLLRIWIVYVGQGDGIVIQLPPPMDGGDQARPAVVVDAGAHRHMERFLERLYPGSEGDPEVPIPLVGAVLTHHDHDHAGGFEKLLRHPRIPATPLYHNGLGTFAVQPGVEPNCPSGMKALVEKRSSGTWFMGCFATSGEEAIREQDLVEDAATLAAGFREDRWTGVYRDLAGAFVQGPGAEGREFRRMAGDGPFEPLQEAPEPMLKLLWPPEPPRRFDGWSETINGNSLTFMLTYGQFQMLFTGDHNKKSQKAILDEYADREGELDCDVLKIPHHGSHHGLESFFKAASPVLSVASMGGRGFTRSWGHPSTDVIRWVGGFHRIYHTHIHESRFKWEEMSGDAHADMVEKRHLLIETDGRFFRLVEVKDIDLLSPPTVRKTERGDGTRWISASEEGEKDD